MPAEDLIEAISNARLKCLTYLPEWWYHRLVVKNKSIVTLTALKN